MSTMSNEEYAQHRERVQSMERIRVLSEEMVRRQQAETIAEAKGEIGHARRLRLMADLALESPTVTKLVPAGFTFLRETADHIEKLEAALRAVQTQAAEALGGK